MTKITGFKFFVLSCTSQFANIMTLCVLVREGNVLEFNFVMAVVKVT